ncbi:uncharacterized protein N7515_005857 [Penicillium bovifimosum]|uniref:Retrovirus-related Pol polyprotein from transposon TNT 1-94-like beta-barrel domain-containing protein n=1 Tax=Penicillium bovifimosum TaxID=126998 RepID=A0A9W9GTY5_9EURO|nr:uncharacterized protein N7515_005857 [Penicillium bovifimosum]KAJ5129818.1 hypothetical protein N7515_005857 [Penicillium bovifimosum]
MPTSLLFNRVVILVNAYSLPSYQRRRWPSGNSKKSKRCPRGGEGHEWRFCSEVNWTLRSPNFRATASKRNVTEENLKKASPQVQEEVAALMKTDPEACDKTTHLALKAPPGDDPPTESLAFLTATISPEVYHLAVDTFAPRQLDHRFRDRFVTLSQSVTEIKMGNGTTKVEGHGTARVVVRDPTSGVAQWATLKDVWYAPTFATNIISASEIKKDGFFFTSELPGIVRGCSDHSD